MQSTDPEPLWRSVVGDTEPWRRGRLFLVLLAVWQLLLHLLVVGSQLLAGNLEVVLYAGLGAIVFWFCYYFIWIGVHWVRWVAGGFSCLLGFAKIIWGLRDGSPLWLVGGVIELGTGSYLALAPAVYFFALRQKAKMRWKEAIVVAAVFGLLLLSTSSTFVALSAYRAKLEREARAFADRAFHSVFVEHDTEFIRRHATARLQSEAGWDRLSAFTTDCYLRLGAEPKAERANGRLRLRFVFPASLVSEGVMFASAQSDQGRVRFSARIGAVVGGEWQLDGIWWRDVMDGAPPGG